MPRSQNQSDIAAIDDLYHRVLADKLGQYGGRLAQSSSDTLPSASAARELQEELEEFISAAAAPADVLCTAFLVDLIISDAFKNFFGDLTSSATADNARRDVCKHLAAFLQELSDSVAAQDREAQSVALENYAKKFLSSVRQLNSEWTNDYRMHIGA